MQILLKDNFQPLLQMFFFIVSETTTQNQTKNHQKPTKNQTKNKKPTKNY